MGLTVLFSLWLPPRFREALLADERVINGVLLRSLFLVGGFLSLILGALGAVLPVLPTVPFLILAAFCFARSSPALERRLLDHPQFGPSIRLWREKGAVSRTGKRAAMAAFAFSAVMGLILSPFPWSMLPLAACVTGGLWIWRRPEA